MIFQERENYVVELPKIQIYSRFLSSFYIFSINSLQGYHYPEEYIATQGVYIVIIFAIRSAQRGQEADFLRRRLKSGVQKVLIEGNKRKGRFLTFFTGRSKFFGTAYFQSITKFIAASARFFTKGPIKSLGCPDYNGKAAESRKILHILLDKTNFAGSFIDRLMRFCVKVCSRTFTRFWAFRNLLRLTGWL